jgi:hypothetical protein
MARQLEQWADATDSSNLALLNLFVAEAPPAFSVEWYRANPRLAMDRLAKFNGNPEFTAYYDESDV